MPEGWKTYKLNELVDQERGVSYGVVQPGQNDPEGVPILKVNNLTNRTFDLHSLHHVSQNVESKYKRTRLKGGEILVSLVGSLGEVFMVPTSMKGFNVVRALAVIPVKSEFSPKWIEYVLKSPSCQHQLEQIATTSVQKTINLKELREIEIPLPVPKEREAISSILSALDDKIELNRQLTKNLEEVCMALFRNWFIDFGPFRNCKFYVSELGEVPDGWEVKHVSEIAPPKKGKNITKKDVIPGEIPVVAGGLLPSTYHNESNTESPVITISASGANAGFVKLYHKEVWSSDSSYIDSTISTFVYTLYLFLKSNQKAIFEMQEGSAQPHIYPRHISALKVCWPQNSILSDFEQLVEPMFLKMKNALQENQTLTNLRDTLLPKLISGEVRVKDVERIVSDVL